MPPYQVTPFRESTKLSIAGFPSYLLGSYDDRSSSTLGYIISDSAVTTVGTVVFQIVSGNPPIVGALITVRGAANSANFNVVNATILSVVTNQTTGVCTVTYAISSTTQANLADHGEVSIPQTEVGETIVNGSSIPVSFAFSTANSQHERAITAVVSFPTIPTAALVVLQQAVFDKDSEYATVNTIATVAASAVTTGPQVTIDPVLGRFFRFNVSGLTGVGTIVAKLIS